MDWHIITGEFPPASGGVGDYSSAVAAGLAAAGDAVHVWCPASAGPPVHISGVQVHAVAGTWGRGDLARVDSALNLTPAPRRLLVQWVPHAFGMRSLNVGFCRWLRRRGRSGDCLEVMVHEPVPRIRGRIVASGPRRDRAPGDGDASAERGPPSLGRHSVLDGSASGLDARSRHPVLLAARPEHGTGCRCTRTRSADPSDGPERRGRFHCRALRHLRPGDPARSSGARATHPRSSVHRCGIQLLGRGSHEALADLRTLPELDASRIFAAGMLDDESSRVTCRRAT